MSTVRTMFETGTDVRDPRRAVEKYYGKYPGLVFQNTSPDGEAHRGDLVVDVPGILEETPDGSGQRPIRVVARPCFLPGFFFIPEVGAQVWVEFVAGDINHPIWTGVWYPEDAAPQTTEGEGPTEFQKVIRTASGHVIQVEDTNGHEAIVIRHKTGSTVEMDRDGRITITDTGNDTSIVSNKISLGTRGGAKEKLVLGDTLKSKLEELIDIATRHVHPTGVGPSGPPATEAASLTTLRTSLLQILSQQNTTD